MILLEPAAAGVVVEDSIRLEQAALVSAVEAVDLKRGYSLLEEGEGEEEEEVMRSSSYSLN